MAEATWVTPQVALSEAITAAKLGQLALARRLLNEIVAREPKNERAWLWVAGLAENKESAYDALNRVLDINPKNQQAINALALSRLQESAQHQNLRAASAHPTPLNGASTAPARPITPAAATAQPVNSWACPLCMSAAAYPARKCPTCKAIVGVGVIEDYAANKGVNEELLLDAAARFEQHIKREDTLDSRINLALIYLNLNRSAEALPHLRKALSMNGANAALGHLAETLAARKLVVAVDDSLTVRKIVSITLERLGYRVMTAKEGGEALTVAAAAMPDLILLDITMPGMDGYQVCKAIKQNPATKRIPVVMLSGKDGFFDKVKGRLAGATDYITKPFQEATLAEAVRKYSS
ncbi:MAG TPA: response regulator [Bryobacteraceae bacterium]|nr:response regulator [Bryobacteraceae bacterium]HPT27650.1 response regulator [Bryobacteraceae bacterium]